ncbi:MAG: hypothetical protein JWN87_3112 [Frankiales bacterium]|nr:hypothetical protein [Frankiales bacterium]MCW2587430.1 hypothetical protein [Frankiales bacterium]
MSVLHEVHVLQLPVRIWARAQEQTDALLREFALISTSDGNDHEVPARLTRLIADLEQRFDGVSTAQEQQLYAAADAGLLVLDELVYQLPTEVAEASVTLLQMFDEADAYCADGTHLLTLAADPEVARFRRWFLLQFVDQIAGGAPVRWPDWPLAP